MRNGIHNIAVFSTTGTGLKDWQQVGTLNRETSLYKLFVKDGFNVTFFTYDTNSNIPSLGFDADIITQKPFVLPRVLEFLYPSLIGILRFFKGRKSSVIITNQAHGGWPAVVAGRIWGAKVIARCGMVHGECSEVLGKKGSRARKKARRERWTFRHADHCVVPTTELAKWIEANYGIESRRISVIPNFVDTDIFKPDTGIEKEYDILSVGRLVSKKRHKLMLESISGSNMKVCIVGSGKDRNDLEQYASENQIDLTVIERIDHDQLADYYNKSRLYVNTALWEGHPKAMIEAMSCGTACIGTKTPGIMNLLKDGQTGILVDSNTDSIRTAVDNLLSNEEERNKLANSARQYAVENFSIQKVFQQYRSVCHNLIDQEGDR